MNVVELFAGTGSFSNVAKLLGYDTFTADIDNQFDVDLVADILTLKAKDFPRPDILWASPPCETFSVASISYHWTGGKGAYIPKTERAETGKKLVLKTIELINDLQPEYWIIENPRGVLRKMPFMQDFYRYTVTYCQYGDTRMKPTDIWTNIPDLKLKPMCKNGDSCHVSAPRGSRTGTQGIKTYKDRSRIPEELCRDILEQIAKRKEVI